MFEKNGLLRHVNKLLRSLFRVPRNDESGNQIVCSHASRWERRRPAGFGDASNKFATKGRLCFALKGFSKSVEFSGRKNVARSATSAEGASTIRIGRKAYYRAQKLKP
jgi:hypothetical protein